MPRKSKEFSQLLHQQQEGKAQQKALAKLQKRVEQGPLGSQIAGIVTNPKGQAKMSGVLESFVEPYLHTATTYEQQEMLFVIAIFAWNLALLPVEQHQSALDKIVQDVSAGKGWLAKRDIRKVLAELMARKLEFFADNKRHIMDFQLEDMGHSYHLSVVSSFPKESTPE